MATIAITGAGRGIGFELVKTYSGNGDKVIALCRDPGSADALQALAGESDGRISIVEMDVGSDDSVRAAAAAVPDERIDVLFNVAGILGSVKPELALGSSDWSVWNDVMNVMTYGPLRVLQAFLPKMQAGSKVINFSSQLAASTWPRGGLYPYVTAKSGLNRLMRSVAIDLKDRGIVVGTIHPGYVQTDMGGPAADIAPEESASGIQKLTAEWPLEKSGDFMKWNGQPHAW